MSRPLTPSLPAWTERFRTAEILTARVAHRNPSRGLVAAKVGTTRQLHAWDIPGKRLFPLTSLPGGTYQGAILSDGSGVIYLHDELGDEKGHYTLVSFDGTRKTDLTPELPYYPQLGISSARLSPLAALSIALNTGFETYLVSSADARATGGLTLIYRTDHLAGGPELSSDGSLLALLTTEFTRGARYSAKVLRTSTADPVGLLNHGEDSSVDFTSFSPVAGDDRLLAYSDRSGRIRPLIWNPVSGEEHPLGLRQLEGDVKPLDWSPDARKIILMQVNRARQSLYLYDLLRDQLTPLLHPPGSLGIFGGLLGREAFFTPDGALFALHQDTQQPIRIVELDPESGSLLQEVLNLGASPPGQPWESVTFSTSDTTDIQAWLAKPRIGKPPFATIIHTHGGPEAVQTEGFLPMAQAWLDNGFAFLSVNYRGSTTFGKAFKEAIWGQPGSLEVEDIVAARNWCVNCGIAHPNRVFLTGYSYGGFLTLLAMGKAPGLWAGGMALAAISDWRRVYELSNPADKAENEALFLGDPVTVPAAYLDASPIAYVAAYDAPLLIIQGRNDARTPGEPIREFQAALQRQGKDVQVMWYEAGHVGPSVDQWIGFQQAMMDFARGLIT